MAKKRVIEEVLQIVNENGEVKDVKVTTVTIKASKPFTYTNEQGEEKTGRSYKFVDDNGKMIDLHFNKDVDLSLFDNMTKFIASFISFKRSNAYEYPRVYAGGLLSDSIVSIF